MNAVIIPDRQTFDRFLSFQQIEIITLTPLDKRNEIESGNVVEVYFQSTTDESSYLGKILENNGTVESIPEGEPQAFSIIVQRLH